MTSTQALIGLFWLPGLICIFFVVVKLCDWFVDMLYQPPKRLPKHWMPDICDQLNDKSEDNRT